MAESRLWEALDYLREHGWCKYRMYEDDGRVCALGAVNAVYPILTEDGDIRAVDEARLGDIARLRAVASELFPDRTQHVLEYNSHDPVPAVNNHPATTLMDVELIFEKAAIRSDEVLG